MSFYCDKCDKYYKSYQSLFNHKKYYHEKKRKVTKKPNTDESVVCEYCDNSYSSKYTLTRHHNTCKKKPVISIQNDGDNNINGDENINGNNNLYNSEQHVNSHNTQNITNVIVNLGNENLAELLSAKEQIKILNKRNKCLEYAIQYIHFNDRFPQFKNIMIDDLKSDKAFKFDINKKDYIVVKKDELLDDIIENRLSDIDEFRTINEDELGKVTKQRVEKYTKKMVKEFENPKSQFIKDQKKNIEAIMYNERDTIKPIQKKIRKLKKKE